MKIEIVAYSDQNVGKVHLKNVHGKACEYKVTAPDGFVFMNGDEAGTIEAGDYKSISFKRDPNVPPNKPCTSSTAPAVDSGYEASRISNLAAKASGATYGEKLEAGKGQFKEEIPLGKDMDVNGLQFVLEWKKVEDFNKISVPLKFV